MTVCSPTTSPPRSVCTPICQGGRSPVIPWRAKQSASAGFRPSASAATSPSRTAVPEGASRLCLWWSSTISTSYPPPRVRAACRTSSKRTFTPTLMLGDITSGIRRAAASTRSRASAVNPVDPITMATPRSAHRPAWATEASAPVKSMTTSAPASAAARPPWTATPMGPPRPATSPASCPTAGPGCSTAPESVSASVARTICTMVRPIRPATPVTTTLVMRGIP